MIDSATLINRFSSFADLQKAHLALMSSLSSASIEGSEQRLQAISELIERIKGTGAILDGAERQAAQSILDYWSAEMVSLADIGENWSPPRLLEFETAEAANVPMSAISEARTRARKGLQISAAARLYKDSADTGYLLEGAAIKEAAQYQDDPDVALLVSVSRARDKRKKQIRTIAICGVIALLTAAVIGLILQNEELKAANRELQTLNIEIESINSQLKTKNIQLDSSVSALTDSVKHITDRIITSIQRGSLSVQEANSLLDFERGVIKSLSDSLSGNHQIELVLIKMLTQVTDGAYWTKDRTKERETAEDAYTRVQRLIKQSPDEPDLQSFLYETSYRLGDAYSWEKNIDAAQKAYEEASDIAHKLANIYPTDVEAQRRLAFISTKLGDNCLLRKTLECGLEYYKSALEINRHILSGPVTDNDIKSDVERDVAIDRVRIGDLLLGQNQLAEASAEYQAALKILNDIVKDNPHNPNLATYKSNLSRTYNDLAQVNERQGEWDAANNLYNLSLEIRRQLATDDSSNNTWLDALANQYMYIGNVLMKMKKVSEAVEVYDRAQRALNILLIRNPENSDWQKTSADAGQKLAAALLLQAKEAASLDGEQLLKRAQVASSYALELRKRRAQDSPDAADRQRELAAAYIGIGDIFKALSDETNAREQYQDALAVIDKFRTAHPADSKVLSSFNQLREDLCGRDPGICS